MMAHENSEPHVNGDGDDLEVVLSVKDAAADGDDMSDNNVNILPSAPQTKPKKKSDFSFLSVPFIQKVMAEMVGTYLLIFVGCASVVVNVERDKVVTLPGIGLVWGLTVMVLIYSLGHISGAHFNPAVTIAFASTNRFRWKHVPAYISAQLFGSTIAAGALRLVFPGNKGTHFTGTLPSGSNTQAFVLEFITTFYLMFTIAAVATDNRAIGQLAGLAIGSSVLVDVLFAGPVTGASMNPARSLGPAIVWNEYKVIWLYIFSPILGAISAAWIYNMLRFTDKPLREILKTASFLKVHDVPNR